MINTESENVRPIFWFVFLLSATIFIMSMLACSPEKRAIRQQDKAYGITISTPRTFQQAAKLWLDIHPCLTPIIKDSTIIKHDTITTVKKIFIPSQNEQYKIKTLDTIIDGISVFADSTGITVKNLNQKEVETRTVYQTKIDQTRVNNLTDSLNSALLQLATEKGIVSEIRTNLSDQKKDTNKWKWYFYGSVFLSIISHILRSYISGWFSSAMGVFKSIKK